MWGPRPSRRRCVAPQDEGQFNIQRSTLILRSDATHRVSKDELLTLRILAGMGPVEAGASRVSTDIESIVDLAAWLNIARTHIRPKLREAEAIGSIGWTGARGKSPMWVSTGFLQEMADEQAARLAFFDAAFDVIFAEGPC